MFTTNWSINALSFSTWVLKHLTHSCNDTKLKTCLTTWPIKYTHTRVHTHTHIHTGEVDHNGWNTWKSTSLVQRSCTTGWEELAGQMQNDGKRVSFPSFGFCKLKTYPANSIFVSGLNDCFGVSEEKGKSRRQKKCPASWIHCCVGKQK